MHILPTLRIATEQQTLMALRVLGVVGRPDIAPLIAQAAREVRKDAEIAGFRKGKAPLKLVIAREAERVRKRALSWLLEAMQEQVLAKVQEERALLGPPEVEYDREVKLEQVQEFAVTFVCTLDPAKDKRLAPEEVAKDPRAALSPKPKLRAVSRGSFQGSGFSVASLHPSLRRGQLLFLS